MMRGILACAALLSAWSGAALAQAPIPPSSVVRFNTLCATCHEGECSARLSFRLDPGATDGHIRRYTGDISPQAARELNALLEHMKLECGYYAIDLHAPKDGRWKAALLQQLHAAEERAYFIPLGRLEAGRHRFTLGFEGEAELSVQLVSATFEIAEQPALKTGNGRVVVELEAARAGEHYLRLRTEQPARLLTLERDSLR
jgi:hypothetical protein